MAPCLRLLKSIFPQSETSENQDQWKKLLGTIKSNKLTLTETPVNIPVSRSNNNRFIRVMSEVKINSETEDRVFGTAKLKRNPVVRSENSDEEAQFHIFKLDPPNLADIVVLTQNREMRLQGKWCLSCTKAAVNIVGTSIRRGVPEILVRGEPGTGLAELYSVNGGVYAEDVMKDKNTFEDTIQDDLAAEQATIQDDLAAAGITQADIDAAQTTFQDDQTAVQASIDAATGTS